MTTTFALPDNGTAWWVVFPARDALEQPAWWQYLLHPGYCHVWACRAAGPEATLVVNHTGWTLQLGVLPMPIGAFLEQKCHQQQALAMGIDLEPGRTDDALRVCMTCVEVVKALLGIRAPWIITPRQLARHLRPLAFEIYARTEELQHG